MNRESHRGVYVRLLAMTLLSFAAMYVLMYAMVDRPANVHPNLNQLYMAGLMAAPMALIELGLMGAMYPNRRLNAAIAVAGLVALGGFFLLIREQTAISDAEFARSMIPHHAGAILMCNEADLTDPELRTLCRDIVAGQQAEIDQMNAVLARLDR